jgi:hypothetical protein
MKFVIRANAARSAEGKPQESPTYWPPGDKGYSRTGSIDKAMERAFTAPTDALAYMTAQGVEANEANEVIEVP